MGQVKLKFLRSDIDRHGNARTYFRAPGRPQVRLRATPGTPEFIDEYHAALMGVTPAPRAGAAPPQRVQIHTLAWLVADYCVSAKFRGYPKNSQASRRQNLLSCCDEPIQPGSADLIGACPLSLIGPKHIRLLRDRKSDLPGAANNRLKYLSSMFAWAMEYHSEIVPSNPVRDVKPLPKKSKTGFHSWTVEEVLKFEDRHSIGSKPRLALALLLYTGARRGDVVNLGRQHVGADEWLRFRPSKTTASTGALVEIPVLPELRDIIDRSPCGDLAFLATSFGRSFTAAGFGNWFRERCDEAGLPHCSAHGLRKAGAAIAAERGATDRQLMAIFGWATAAQATVYTKAARRRKLAVDAPRLLRRNEDK